jgi:hypothetical protein
MSRPDGNLIADEVRNGAAMLTHACGVGRWRIDASSQDRATLAAEVERMVQEHRRLWLARNRRGGLEDSVSRLKSS